MKLPVLISSDVESLPNFFSLTVTVYDPSVKEKKYIKFEISEWVNDYARMVKFFEVVASKGHLTVWFNSEGYDYPVIHELINFDLSHMSGIEIALRAHEKTDDIINKTEWGKRNKHRIWDNKKKFKTLDLMLINHYDRSTKDGQQGGLSLKEIEFNMRLDNIQPLPIEPGKPITRDEADTTLDYNEYDVFVTEELLKFCIPMVERRFKLTEETGRDHTNMNDVTIGKEMLVDLIGRKHLYYRDGGRVKPKQSRLDSVNIGNVLYDYLDFKSPELIALKEWFKQQTVRVNYNKAEDGYIKGASFQGLMELDTSPIEHLMGRVFTPTDVKKQKMAEYIDERVLSGNTSPVKIDQSNPDHKGLGKFSKDYLKASVDGDTSGLLSEGKIDKFNITYGGLQYDIGVGGFHASRKRESFYSDDEYIIIDADVSGYYVSLGIANNAHPKHVPANVWIPAYASIPEKRAQFPKGSAENTAWKLAGNSAYGLSMEVHSSPFFDPSYMLEITINGQLSLMLLVEMITQSLSYCHMLQANTDGITFIAKRTEGAKAVGVCQEWEKKTNLELEYIGYKSMHLKDVNNYMAVKGDGSTKVKGGAYNYKRQITEKGHSFLVIRRVCELMLKGEVTEDTLLETLENWDDDFDFFGFAKAPKNSRFHGRLPDGFEIRIPDALRYMVSTSGYELIKTMPTTEKQRRKNPEKLEKESAIQKGFYVRNLNNINDFRKSQINYQWYADKILKFVGFEEYEND